MNMNVPKELHDRFKAATAAQGKQMTDVLLAYIEQYVTRYEEQQLKKGGRG